jgi:hypothetical protein
VHIFDLEGEMKIILTIVLTLSVSACASGSAIRTSQNSAIIQAAAAPVCGGIGAAQVAQQQAAIETLRAGYDRYVVTSGASENNVRVSYVPGSATTYGTVYGNSVHMNTTYQPQTMVSGNHSQSLNIVMFKDGDVGAANAISAREVWDRSGPNS